MAILNETIDIAADNLIVGDFMLMVSPAVITLTVGEGLKRGTVMGRTENGKYKIAKADAADGSQNPVAILIDSVTKTEAGDINGFVYLTGAFNKTAVVCDSSITIATAKNALHTQSIFLIDVI